VLEDITTPGLNAAHSNCPLLEKEGIFCASGFKSSPPFQGGVEYIKKRSFLMYSGVVLLLLQLRNNLLSQRAVFFNGLHDVFMRVIEILLVQVAYFVLIVQVDPCIVATILL
jgi:hypothetical protein